MNRLVRNSAAVTARVQRGCLTLMLGLAALIPVALHADGVSNPTPSYYQEPGISSNRSYVGQHPSELIDPFTGKLQFHSVDLFIPGNGGMDITVQRSYSSPNDWPGSDGSTTPQGEATVAGYGWTMHYGRILVPAGTPPCAMPASTANDPVLELPDGSRNTLYVALDNASYITTDHWKGLCALDGNGNANWTVFAPNGTRYQLNYVGPQFGANGLFWSTWYTTQITDLHNNSLNFTYTLVAPRILGMDTIVASDGRNVSFSYKNAVLDNISTTENVTCKTKTWTYAYDVSSAPGYPLLTGITRPDGATWGFAYNYGSPLPGSFAINKVTYPKGATIDYEYQAKTLGTGQPQSAVVSKKTATACADCTPDVWNFTYTPATQPVQVNGDSTVHYTITPGQDLAFLDMTTVVGPEGTHAYYHIGYNSAVPGLACFVGTRVAVVNGDGNNTGWESEESFRFGYQIISNQSCTRPYSTISDAVVGALLMYERDSTLNAAKTAQQFSDFDVYGNAQTIVEGPIASTNPDGTSHLDPSRTTQRTFNIDTTHWSIRQVKSESKSVSTDSLPPYTSSRTFDPLTDDLLTETDAGVTTTYTYTPEGDLATRQDANSHTTTYSNYRRGIPQTVEYPESITTTRIVDDLGNVLADTDGENVTRIYQYDELNRLTKITPGITTFSAIGDSQTCPGGGGPITGVDSGGNVINIAWTPTTRTTTRGGNTEVVTYDGFGRTIQIDNSGINSAGPALVTRTFKYDSAGRQIFASQPNSNVGEQTTYDIVGRVDTVCHGTVFNSNQCTSGRGYFYGGNTVQVTNENGYAFTYTYDLWGDPLNGQLSAITTPDASANSVITRNVLGQVTGIGLGPVLNRLYTYNDHFFLDTKFDPETGTTTFGYDPVGNVVHRIFGGLPTAYAYDALNRLTSIAYGNPYGYGESGIDYVPTAPGAIKGYYKDNQLKFVDNGVARRDYWYDVDKNLKQEKLTIGSSIFTTNYAYNANDALSTITYPTGTVIALHPDDFNRPTQALPFITTVSYYPSGQTKSFTDGGGVTTNIGLNTDLRPNNLQIGTYDSGGHLTTQILNSTYVYDGLGSPRSINDIVDSSYNRNMTYDNLGRLSYPNGPWGNGVVTYDGTGNIQSMFLGDAIRNFTYDGYNRLQKVDVSSLSFGGDLAWKAFTYDGSGNVTSNALHTFTYDGASNMRAIDYTGGSCVLSCSGGAAPPAYEYDYDGLNQRVATTTNGQTTYFVANRAGQLIYEQTPGAGSKEYIYLNGHQIAVRTLP